MQGKVARVLMQVVVETVSKKTSTVTGVSDNGNWNKRRVDCTMEAAQSRGRGGCKGNVRRSFSAVPSIIGQVQHHKAGYKAGHARSRHSGSSGPSLYVRSLPVFGNIQQVDVGLILLNAW